MANSVIPIVAPQQQIYNERERTTTRAEASVPDLGSGNLSPPTYLSIEGAVSVRGEDKVPSYDEVMADGNKYHKPY